MKKNTEIQKVVDYFLNYHKEVIEGVRPSYVLEWWLLNANEFGFSGDDEDADDNEEQFCNMVIKAIKFKW